jgi:signal transduction histidine kinase
LSEDLLELAKADADGSNLDLKNVSLRELIIQTVDLFKPQFVDKEIVVETHCSEEAEAVKSDRDKLARVISNLLQNAFQYTPRGGRVRVFTEKLPECVKVIFVNSGQEIAVDQLPLIFERFYRGEQSRSREHGGAGIGLAIVKQIVQAHRGQVGAENSPGETRIWFTLPA